MVELIASAPSWVTFATAAAQTGFADPVTHVPLTAGTIATGGSWFYNAVGSVVTTPGTYDTSTFPPTQLTAPVVDPNMWVRVRFNGDVPNFSTLIAAWQAAGITIYQLVTPSDGSTPFWSSDGTTPAPSWVAGVGVIQ